MKNSVFAALIMGAVSLCAVEQEYAMEVDFKNVTIGKRAVAENTFVTVENARILEENGNKFVRLEQPANDPKARSRITYVPSSERKAYFDKSSFCISALLRMSGDRNGNFYVYTAGAFRLGVMAGKNKNLDVYMWISVPGQKGFSIYANTGKTPVPADEWIFIHAGIDRNGSCSIYINGELSVSGGSLERFKEMSLVPSAYSFSLGYNKPADKDNPVAKMDLMKLQVKTGLMSRAEVEKLADQWLESVKEDTVQ